MAARFAVTGNFAQVEAAILGVVAKLGVAEEATEEIAAEIIAARAAEKAPRFTGHMAASVDDLGGVVVVDTPYAGYQEYGTRRHAAQPFLRPAKDESEPAVKVAAERIIAAATR